MTTFFPDFLDPFVGAPVGGYDPFGAPWAPGKVSSSSSSMQIALPTTAETGGQYSPRNFPINKLDHFFSKVQDINPILGAA